jgi:tetratricopeptide (TPR) repeat protein
VRLDLDAAHRHHAVATRMARTYQLRQAIVVTTAISAMLAHLAGDLDSAEACYREAHALQLRADAVDADEQLVLALITLRCTQGRLGELADQLRQLYEARLPAAGDAFALALLELGRRAEAAEVVAQPRPPIAVDFLWLIFMTIRGLAVAEVGDAATAAAVYAELLPYAEQVAGGGTSGFVLTPVARALGHLARSLGRAEDARAHFEQARAVASRCGSAPWLAQVDADLARLG